MDWTQIILSALTLVGSILLGSAGLLRIVSRMVDSRIVQANTASEIALKREQADFDTTQSYREQSATISDLLRTSLLQQAQIMAQLSSDIREVLDELRTNQRAATNNVEDVLRAYGISVGKIELGFRGISDEFLLVNGSFTRFANKTESNMESIRDMVLGIREDISVLRRDNERGGDRLDDVVEIAVAVRNTVVRVMTQDDEKLIRAPDDYRPTRTPDLANSDAISSAELPEAAAVPVTLENVETKETAIGDDP